MEKKKKSDQVFTAFSGMEVLDITTYSTLDFFIDKKGNFCFLSNLKEHLNYYGFQFSESRVGAMMGCFGFYYTRKVLASKEVLHGRSETFEGMFQFLQIQFKELFKKETFSDIEAVLLRIRSLLSMQKPVLLWMDDYYLEYSPYYKQAHYWSPVNVIGSTQDTLILFDNEIRHLPLELVFTAICDESHRELYYVEEKPLGLPKLEEAAIIGGLERGLGLFGKSPMEKEFWGLQAMKCFAEDIAACREASVIHNFCYLFNRAGGPIATRRNVSELCGEIKEKWPVREVEECEKIYRKLEEDWRKIGNLLYKLAATMDDALRGRILLRIHEVMEEEQKGISSITRLISSGQVLCKNGGGI